MDSQEPANPMGYVDYSKQKYGISAYKSYDECNNKIFRFNTMSLRIIEDMYGYQMEFYKPFATPQVVYKYYFVTL